MSELLRRSLLVLLASCVLLIAAACASHPPPPVTPGAPFSEAEAENMFKAGYAAISERYIESLGAETIALGGLRGFSDVDPSLDIGKVRNVVELRIGDRLVATESTPKARDVDGWAKLTVAMWQDARAVSPRIAAASQEDVYQAVFERVTAMLDANSHYASAAQARIDRRRRDGYHGIGVRLELKGGEPVIVEVAGRGPGERAGLRVGDVLTRIDGRPVAGSTLEEVTGRLQEDAAGWVRLSVRRGARDVRQFVVLRSYLIPETVHESYADGVLYLAIDRFNQGTADAIAETLGEFGRGWRPLLRGVVLDLRGNPGGLLQQAVKVTDLFLARGPILSTRGRHPDSSQDYYAGGDDMTHGLPLAVLVDGDTASAAELTAGSLADRGRAVIIGSTSFGKGTVQMVVPMPNGGELAFTWSYTVLPSGVDMRAGGVRPTLCTSGLYVPSEDNPERLFTREAPFRAVLDGVGCPAERRDGPVDPAIARWLVTHPDRYAAALSGSSMLAGIPAAAQP